MSNRKPNKMRVENVSDFYSRSMKPWLQYNNPAIYSAHNG